MLIGKTAGDVVWVHELFVWKEMDNAGDLCCMSSWTFCLMSIHQLTKECIKWCIYLLVSQQVIIWLSSCRYSNHVQFLWHSPWENRNVERNWNKKYECYLCMNNNLIFLFLLVLFNELFLVHLLLNDRCCLSMPPPLMHCLPHNFLVVVWAFLRTIINFQLKKLHRQFTDLPLWLIPLLNHSELSKFRCVVWCKIESRKIWWPLKWMRHSVTRKSVTRDPHHKQDACKSSNCKLTLLQQLAENAETTRRDMTRHDNTEK